MYEMLVLIFKSLLLLVGIVSLLYIFIAIITAPIRKKKEEETKRAFIEALDEISNQCIEELEKQEKTKKKPTRKPRNTKKNEEK